MAKESKSMLTDNDDSCNIQHSFTDTRKTESNKTSFSPPNLSSRPVERQNMTNSLSNYETDILKSNADHTEEYNRNNVFITTSSRHINFQHSHDALNGLQFPTISNTQFQQSMFSSVLIHHDHGNNNDNKVLVNDPITCKKDTNSLDISTSDGLQPGDEDSVNVSQHSPQRQLTLVNKTGRFKSLDSDEIKSVKFQTLEDTSTSNNFRNFTKTSKISPINDKHNLEHKTESSIRVDTTKSEKCESDITNSYSQFQVSQQSGCRKSGNLIPDNYTDDDTNISVRTGLCRCTNLSTQRGRRNHALLIMLVSVVPVIALVIQNAIDLTHDNSKLSLHKKVKQQIMFSVETGNVIHQTQIERGISSLYVSSGGDENVTGSLLKAYTETDNAINSLTLWVETPTSIDHLRSVHSYYQWIQHFRRRVISSPAPNVTVSEVIKFYSDDNAIITRWVGDSIQQSESGDLWKTLVGYYMLILSKEQAGVERALGSAFYAQGGFDNIQMLEYLDRKILGITYLERCQDYSANVRAFLVNNFIGQETDLSIRQMRETILANSSSGSDVYMGSLWFWNMTKYINVLKKVQDTLASDIIAGLQKEVDNLTDALLESICVMVVALVLFPLVIITVYRLTNRIQDFAQTLQERTRDLDIERKRSETLLFELLPVSVARKLLNHEDVLPVSYPAVTVFFSDIVGFTTICSKSSPIQVIDMLNSLYRMFDDIIDTHDVYKVETIGDAYMVVSGLPQQNIDGHAREMANMALDVREAISHLTVQHLYGETLQMRIGLNSGPVVAGVVGHKMPRYCLFGDTVNVASRMESTSLPLHIQISESCRKELEKAGGFIIRGRGKVEIKGKGEMTTYWLEGVGSSPKGSQV